MTMTWTTQLLGTLAAARVFESCKSCPPNRKRCLPGAIDSCSSTNFLSTATEVSGGPDQSSSCCVLSRILILSCTCPRPVTVSDALRSLACQLAASRLRAWTAFEQRAKCAQPLPRPNACGRRVRCQVQACHRAHPAGRHSEGYLSAQKKGSLCWARRRVQGQAASAGLPCAAPPRRADIPFATSTASRLTRLRLSMSSVTRHNTPRPCGARRVAWQHAEAGPCAPRVCQSKPRERTGGADAASPEPSSDLFSADIAEVGGTDVGDASPLSLTRLTGSDRQYGGMSYLLPSWSYTTLKLPCGSLLVRVFAHVRVARASERASEHACCSVCLHLGESLRACPRLHYRLLTLCPGAY